MAKRERKVAIGEKSSGRQREDCSWGEGSSCYPGVRVFSSPKDISHVGVGPIPMASVYQGSIWEDPIST